MRLSHSLNVIFGAAAVSGAGVRRDRRRLVVLFLLPTLVMAVVGFAMGGYSSASFEVGLLDRANTSESRALAAALVSNEQFQIRDYTNEERLKIAVFRGRMNAGILIPPGWHGDQNLGVYLSSCERRRRRHASRHQHGIEPDGARRPAARSSDSLPCGRARRSSRASDSLTQRPRTWCYS